MEVELVDKLSAEAVILTVRWIETGKKETATVCVGLSVEERPRELIEGNEREQIEVPERVRRCAIAQAQQLAQLLTGLHGDLSAP